MFSQKMQKVRKFWLTRGVRVGFPTKFEMPPPSQRTRQKQSGGIIFETKMCRINRQIMEKPFESQGLRYSPPLQFSVPLIQFHHYFSKNFKKNFFRVILVFIELSSNFEYFSKNLKKNFFKKIKKKFFLKIFKKIFFQKFLKKNFFENFQKKFFFYFFEKIFF